MVAVLKTKNQFAEQQNNLSRSLRLLGVEPLPLTDRDLDGLRESGISNDVAAACHLFRVDSWNAKQLVASKKTGDLSGIVFPYFSQNGDIRYSVRRDNPDLIRKSSTGEIKPDAKYLRAAEKNHIYIPPMADFSDLWISSKDLIIVEGEKKAISLQAEFDRTGRDVVAVGLPGVWNWRSVVGKTTNEDGENVDIKGVISEFGDIEFLNRNVTIFFDTNVLTNQSVAAAERALAEELHRRGACVRTGRIPELPGINGIDDVIGQYPDQVQEIFNRLTDYIPQSRHANRVALVKEFGQRPGWGDVIQEIPESPITPNSISKSFIEVIFRGLAEAGFSDKAARVAIVIASKLTGNERQKMSYTSLYPLLAKCGENIPIELDSSQQRTVRNYIRKLEDEQRRTGITLFHIHSGYQKNGENFPTTVDPGPLFSLVATVDGLARNKPGYDRSKNRIRLEVMPEALAILFDKYTRPEVKKNKINPVRANASDAKRAAAALAGFFRRSAGRGISLECTLDSLIEFLPKDAAPLLSLLVEKLNSRNEPEGEQLDEIKLPDENVPEKCTVSIKEDSTFYSPNPGPQLLAMIEVDQGEHESFGHKKGNPLEKRDIEIKCPKVEKNVLCDEQLNTENKELTVAEKCSTRSVQPALATPENSQECTEVEELKTSREKLKRYADEMGSSFKDKLKEIGGLSFYFKTQGILNSLNDDSDFKNNLLKIDYPEGKNTRPLFDDLRNVVGLLSLNHQESIPVSL